MKSNQITSQDYSIKTDDGLLAVKSWQSDCCDTEKATILLFHDSIGCIELWRDFPALLAEATNRQVVAYDRLGFGQSEICTDKISSDFISSEAEKNVPALCEHIGFNDFIALGHSVGGAMAIHSAALHPIACKGLITIAAQTFAEDITLKSILEAKELFSDETQIKRLSRYHGIRSRWVVDAWLNTWLSPEFANWTLNDILPQVPCRTLVIHGEEDEYGSTIHPHTIAGDVKGHAELEILPNTFHMPHRENAPWVVNRIASFLNDAP